MDAKKPKVIVWIVQIVSKLSKLSELSRSPGCLCLCIHFVPRNKHKHKVSQNIACRDIVKCSSINMTNARLISNRKHKLPSQHKFSALSCRRADRVDSGRRLHSRRPPCHLTPRPVREKHWEDTGRQWMQRRQRWWWKPDKRRDGEATRREDSRQARRRRTQSKEVDRKKTTEEADRGGGSRRSERRWEGYHKKEFCQRVTTDQCLLKLL